MDIIYRQQWRRTKDFVLMDRQCNRVLVDMCINSISFAYNGIGHKTK